MNLCLIQSTFFAVDHATLFMASHYHGLKPSFSIEIDDQYSITANFNLVSALSSHATE
jgi:hypothetical protein